MILFNSYYVYALYNLHKPHLAACGAWNPFTWEAEAGQPEFKASLGYLVRFCLKREGGSKGRNLNFMFFV